MTVMKGREAALKEHETLSQLWQNNPGIFESVTRNMLQKAIGEGSNKDKLITIQQELDAEKEALMKESLAQLQSQYNGGKSE